jgi:hypothetical protein
MQTNQQTEREKKNSTSLEEQYSSALYEIALRQTIILFRALTRSIPLKGEEKVKRKSLVIKPPMHAPDQCIIFV